MTFICSTLDSIQELGPLTGATIFVNVSGLGAKDLAVDNTVTAVRGQTMFVKCDQLTEASLLQGSEYTYIIPRPLDGGVILGGVS